MKLLSPSSSSLSTWMGALTWLEGPLPLEEEAREGVALWVDGRSERVLEDQSRMWVSVLSVGGLVCARAGGDSSVRSITALCDRLILE